MSRFIVPIDGCPDLSPTDNSTVVINDGNGLIVKANLNAINSSNSGKIDTCVITKANVTDASECTGSKFRDFPGTLFDKNGLEVNIPAKFEGGACRAALPDKCSDYSYQAKGNANIFQLTLEGNNAEMTGDGAPDKIGNIAWATTTINLGTGGPGGGLEFQCGTKTMKYSYDCFNLEIANSCTDECKSFLVFTPKDKLPAGCETSAVLGGGDDTCTNGFGIINLPQQNGQFYLDVNCDPDSGTVCTMLSNTVQQCSNCSL